MPYIRQDIREDFNAAKFLNALDSGELNYIITMLIKNYIDFHGHKYKHMNDVIGALEGAKLEFYRRIVVPYENNKIIDNGDVY